MAPKELSELTVFNRRKAHLLGQITCIRNSLENVDSPLNQVEIRTKLASLSEVKAKIDKLRTESYRVLSDEELMDFETSLDTMEVDADNLEVSLNTLLESSNVDTSEASGMSITECLSRNGTYLLIRILRIKSRDNGVT
ncbi:hypothetical protein TNCV_1926261 [Trichonephila clavipes]|nr:hypothetical protein TNCV_1926261 [Trichonephila clavipes]